MGWSLTDRKFLIALALVLAFGLALASFGTTSGSLEPLPNLAIVANSAPLEVFGALPGLGPALSGRIVDARELSPFRSIDDLDRRVKGIGPAKVALIRPFLRFDPTPVPSR